jgi:hypothetical protein
MKHCIIVLFFHDSQWTAAPGKNILELLSTSRLNKIKIKKTDILLPNQAELDTRPSFLRTTVQLLI